MTTETSAAVDARPLVERILRGAIERRASDLHMEPVGAGYEIRSRVDGVLGMDERLDGESGRAAVARLMVMARLLTYRLDVPQEGRVTLAGVGDGLNPGMDVELRLSVMPTIHGLRAAVRMPADAIQAAVLDGLGLPDMVRAGLERFVAGDSGMLLFTGPAGSGKTTSMYATLRHIVANGSGLSVVALEDPVERRLAGITQIEVSPFGQLTYERALRSMLRQDPQVLMLGEIRDAATASLAIGAALSGHRLVTALHAATAGGAIARLLEMGIEPYQITSSVSVVVAQRLLRRSTGSGGYLGRIPVAEMVVMDPALKKAVLDRADSDALARAYGRQATYRAMADVAADRIAEGLTDAAEARRVLGLAAETSSRSSA
jgi:type II secretory ATPase GspE/PulE/Tfp pilus assembly ATPase PilB-like protein